MTVVYLGTHMPHWLAIPSTVPLFVSNRRLAGRRSLPRARTWWALDSGGFSELSLYGRWRTTPEEYVTAVQRYDHEIGQLCWAAPQDWMCEPVMLAKTGLTVVEHQARTVDNFLRLRDLWGGLEPHDHVWRTQPDVCPFMPVLQGWELPDYQRCADMYEAAGVDLTGYPVVGLGSVCRRQAAAEIAVIAETFARQGLQLHGFGVKARGLAGYARHLDSTDSMAWSYDGRRTPGCAHGKATRNEANCREFALAWHTRTTTTIGAAAQQSARPEETAA